MSDSESFVSIDSALEIREEVSKNTEASKGLDCFLDFDISYLSEEEKCNYIGPSVCPRTDYIEIKNEKIQFLENENMERINHILHNRTKEEVDTFLKLKKELFTIAYKNQNNKIKNNNTNEKEKEEKKESTENTKKESENNEPIKSIKSFDLLNNDLLSASIGNKIEDTYNDIKSGVNWIGNFFSNTNNADEKKHLCVFYSDLYFFNDVTIIRYLDTYKFNFIKTLNKIVKCILWRQVTVRHFNDEMDERIKKDEQKEKEPKEKEQKEKEQKEKEQKETEQDIGNEKRKKETIKENDKDKNEKEKNEKEKNEKEKRNRTEINWRVKNSYINPKHIKNSIIKTSIFRCGFDNKSRPILYIKVQDKLNIEESDLFLNLIYNVDMCLNSVNYNKCYEKEKNETYWNSNKFDESVLQLVVVVDCLKFDLNNMVSVDCIKKIITCFNEFYTDILYRMYIINVPSFFKKVWSLFNMFIDNHTLKKIIIINKNNISMMYEHINKSMMKHFDRTNDTKIDNIIFFPSTTLYYKYDVQHYHILMTHLNTWVDKMISVNHG